MDHWTYKVITAPTSEPITLAECKTQLRVESSFTDDDTWINDTIPVVREQVEGLINRALMNQTLELALPEFKDVIELPKPPLSSLTSVKYYDDDNALQTLASSEYIVNDYDEPTTINKLSTINYPSTFDRPDAVLVRYQAGYPDAASVPAMVKQAMLMIMTDLYDNRSSITNPSFTTKVEWTPQILSLLSLNKTSWV